MANLLNSNPIIITGVLASYKAAVAATLGTLFTLRIERIFWRTPNIAGDVCLITDPANGANKMRLVCEVTKISQIVDWSANPKMWSDFCVDQLDSGELEIYTR
jgi:hypothetical protein